MVFKNTLSGALEKPCALSQALRMEARLDFSFTLLAF